MSPLFPLIQSDLDLNGPILSFNTQPVGTSCSVASGIATFIGIATATFPASQTERETNTGTVTHQWYSGTTALSDGTTSGVTITGSATTTLTLSGLTSPLPISGQVFVQAGYDPDDLSPNAINEPINSDDATLTVFPTISIDTQPTSTSVVEDIPTTFSVVASTSDSSTGLGYQWYLNSNEISGETSSTLSITRPDPGQDKVYCEVSHPTAQPGIVTTTEVNLDVASSRAYITWELIGAGTRQGKGERNIATAGPFTTRARANINARILQVFSPEKDLDVKITLGGAAGGTRGNNRGGEGGISVFKMTLKKNTEYTVKLGVNSYAGGGPRGGNNGGGGLAVIYEKAKVIAVCGGGGGAGTNGRGGDGGGCNVRGEDGPGGGARGGVKVDTLPPRGMTQDGQDANANSDLSQQFANGSSGSGRLSGCTIGSNYYKNLASPCDDLGTGIPFRNTIGNTMSDTTSTSTGPITRGYKPGQGHRNNGGAGSGNGGGGGAGARGGFGTGGNRGGGGASGYIVSGGEAGEVRLLDSTTLSGGTQGGGNDDVAFISIETYNPSLDGQQEPLIPPKSSNLSTERTVNWNVSRSGPDRYELRFEKQSGTGPSELRLAQETSSAMNSQISAGAVYKLTNTGSADGNQGGVILKVENNALFISNSLDNPFHNRLTVSPDQGTFTASTNPVEYENGFDIGTGPNSDVDIKWTANW